MKTRFIDINEELKTTRSSWKLKLIVAVVFKYGDNDKKVETEILIHSINDQTIMLENDLDAFVNKIIKSFMKEYNEVGLVLNLYAV